MNKKSDKVACKRAQIARHLILNQLHSGRDQSHTCLSEWESCTTRSVIWLGLHMSMEPLHTPPFPMTDWIGAWPTGTDSEIIGNLNAPPAVTRSAIIYTLRCMVSDDIPLNQGCLKPIEIRIPPHTLLCPGPGAAVVGGNVLTSQRVTDVVLKAFLAASASQVRSAPSR